MTQSLIKFVEMKTTDAINVKYVPLKRLTNWVWKKPSAQGKIPRAAFAF